MRIWSPLRWWSITSLILYLFVNVLVCLTSKNLLSLPVGSALFPVQFPDLPSQPRYIMAGTGEFGKYVFAPNYFDVIHQRAPVASTLLLAASSTNLALKDSVSSFIASQLALDQIGTFLCGFLLIWALRHMSTRMIPSWSDIPGMVLIEFTKEGVLVQNRSRMASPRVHSRCNWCSSHLEYLLIYYTALFFLQSLVGAKLSQSMSLALKSPATIMVH